MLRKQKGQGMTEFALILPLLLLLLLGIIEASRVMWAYITVQQAAREAARYAVTGRPYLDSNTSLTGQLNVCIAQAPEPDPIKISGAQPWLCEEETKADGTPYNPRVIAVKAVAIQHGRTLNVSVVCDDPAEYNGACANQPGAFGVLVQGQVTTKTITGTTIVAPNPVVDHPGYQGLNIQVNTFYNVEMITPIYDVVMGGNYLRLEGRAQLQNEGLDETAGILPPPPINPPPPPVQDDDGLEYTGNPQIWSPNGYTFQQSDLMRIHLDDHLPNSPFNIYLAPTSGTGSPQKLQCSVTDPKDVVPVDAAGDTNPDVNCTLITVPAGTYTLYSTAAGTSAPAVATALDNVIITPGGTPKIEFEASNNIWAANSSTYLRLFFHPTGAASTPYTVKLFDAGGALVNEITTSATGQSTEQIPWIVADIAKLGKAVCDYAGGTPCTVKSYNKSGAEVASAQVYVNQPKVVLNSGPGPYARGEIVYITLTGHTPGRRYTIRVQGQSPEDVTFFETRDADGAGNVTDPATLAIPTGCGFGKGWPNGDYEAASFPLAQSTPKIAASQFTIETPPDPFITVDGGYTWTPGASIDIRVHQHTLQTLHYLEFDGERIPTIASNDTFLTGNCGDAVVNFTIPEDTTQGTYTIESFLASNSAQQASRTITILDQPRIRVVEGQTVLPDQTITIELTSHVPNTTYRIFYADKQLLAVPTDPDGEATVKYNLGTGLPKLPKTPPPDLTNPNNYGTPYEMNSQTVISPTTKVAKTTLALRGADLVVKEVKIPATTALSTTVPVQVVVQNVQPITITRWVDVDLYFNPKPIAPSYLKGYNFPGDIKYWKNTVGPNETFVITHNLTTEELGLYNVYGYADTSGKVFEAENAGEVNNPNNLNSSTMLVNCVGGQFADPFSAALPGWTWQTYGDGNAKGSGNQISGGQLVLNNSGSNDWVDNDHIGGLGLLHRTVAIPSSSGLDVAVQVTGVDLTAPWARAGLEIRNSLDSNSPKIVLAVSRNNNANSLRRHFVMAATRNGGDMAYVNSEAFWRNNHRVDLVQRGPVWLRIQRQPGAGGQFNIYYQESSGSPPAFGGNPTTIANWWGAPKASVTVSGIGDNVYVGLFHTPYSGSTAGNAKFNEFRVFPDPVLCGATEEQPTRPPGLQVCNELLDDRSFENPATSTSWFSRPDQPAGIVFRTSDGGAYNGVFKYRAASGTNNSVNPNFHFYQEFTLPDWIISGTTKLDLQFYKKVRSFMSGATLQAADKVYAVVVAPPSAGDLPHPNTWTQITEPVEVLNGASSAPVGSFEAQWTLKALSLPVKAGVNLESYANKRLYLYFYNNSNTGTPACSGACRTQFDFDDASLMSCTTEPAPSPVSTRIKGKLTLNFSDGSFGELPFVKVWAYSVNDNKVYETFTIQGGEFNFYNLPATAAGTEYTIFAQYYLEQGTQLEVLAAETSTILRSGVHTDNNPAPAFLNLFTLQPLQ